MGTDTEGQVWVDHAGNVRRPDGTITMRTWADWLAGQWQWPPTEQERMRRAGARGQVWSWPPGVGG